MPAARMDADALEAGDDSCVQGHDPQVGGEQQVNASADGVSAHCGHSRHL